MRTTIRHRAVALLGVVLLGSGLVACGGSDDTTAGDKTDDTTADADTGPCSYAATADAASKQVDPPPATPSGASEVAVKTNLGDFTMTLDTERTPCTAGSFSSLAEQGYFDDTTCHRLTVQNIFVLQCGDPSATGRGGPGYEYADELDGTEKYPAGTLAMANSGPDTNGSQFFIVYEDTELPPSYTVFGSVDADGLELARGVAREGLGPDGVAPAQPVELTTVTVE